MKTQDIKDNLKQLSLSDFFLCVFFYVDEIYKQIEQQLARSGPKPIFSDSQAITLNLVGQMITNSENGWYNFVKKNFLSLFLHLVERSRFHRRCKDLQAVTERIRQCLIQIMGFDRYHYHVMDSLPVPVCQRARASRNLRFATEYNLDNALLYGHCAAKKQDFYGFRLHSLATIQGVPVHYILAPASVHNVNIAPELLESYRNFIAAGGDKGYVGLEKKLLHPQEYQLLIAKKSNQKKQNSKEEKLFLAKLRRIIETIQAQLTDQFSIQSTRAISPWGLQSRIIAKISAFTFAIFLNFITQQPLLNIKNFIF